MSEQPGYNQFCWNELVTSDVAAAKEFYSKLHGWTYQDHDMNGMIYTMAKSGDKEICGMMPLPDQSVPPHWRSYISVENLDATILKAQNIGATIIVPAMQVGNMGRLAIVVDPTGAHIAFWQKI